MGDEKNDELDLKDKDHDRHEKFIEKDYSQCDQPIHQRMIDELIRGKKGLKMYLF